MRNYQQCPLRDATVATLGDATFENARPGSIQPWIEKHIRNEWFTTEQLQCYGATFWKPIVPEPGYRLVEDHERVGPKPKGCRYFWEGSWFDAAIGSSVWDDPVTYAVPIKQVVAWVGLGLSPKTMYVATFANPIGDPVEAARLVLEYALGKPVTITVGAEKESKN